MATQQSAERSLAPLASDDPLTQRHYVAQLALLLALRRALKALWSSLDRRNLKETVPEYATKVAAVVNEYALANISISADFYDEVRARDGAPVGFTTPIIDPPLAQDVEESIKGALDPLWTPLNLGSFTELDDAQARQDALDLAEAEAEASAQARAEENAEKFAADAGRNELIGAIESDQYANGWARVTKEGACSFCMLMAIRGAVYKSAGTAGENANSRFKLGSGTAKFHNNCRCTITPLFGYHYEAPAHVRQAEKDYEDATSRVRGSKEKQKAWRRAYEDRVDGREINGKPRTAQGRSAARQPDSPLGFDALSADQIRNQIRILDGLKDSEYKTKQMARLRKRLAELS